jgi:HD-like signal output (HDOD) protein
MTLEGNPTSLLDIVKSYASSEKLSLPVFPPVAIELQQIMADEDIPLDQIAKTLCKDQALASQVLKLANSAFFSGLNRVRTIREALMRLGVNQVFNCLMVSCQSNLYTSKNPFIANYLQVLWRHALATAIGAKWLLQKGGYADLADEGFLAGLLHDIGKLLLLRVIETLNSEHSDIKLSDEFITEILDSMHVEQGYNLMEEWSIPPNYCNTARDHHLEEFDSANVLLMAVRIADQVTRKTGMSLKEDPNLIPVSLPEVHAMGIKEIVLAELEIVIEDAMELEIAM